MKLDWSKIRLNQLKIAEKIISAEFKSGLSPQKHLGFQPNIRKYKRKTLNTFNDSWKTCELLLWDLRGSVPSNSTSVYWNKIYNRVLVESSCCKINKWWSKTFEWDFKVISVGVCVVQIQERRVHRFEACTWLYQ